MAVLMPFDSSVSTISLWNWALQAPTCVVLQDISGHFGAHQFKAFADTDGHQFLA